MSFFTFYLFVRHRSHHVSLKSLIVSKSLICTQPVSQSCKMSILLQGAKFSNQILPKDKYVICNIFDVFSKLNLHWAIFCMESLKRKHKSFQKGLILKNCMFFQTFYPNLQTFLQGLIPKIPDVSQL